MSCFIFIISLHFNLFYFTDDDGLPLNALILVPTAGVIILVGIFIVIVFVAKRNKKESHV